MVVADTDVSRLYGALFARLRRAGTPVPANDVWIAASAQAAGAHLVTFDADFRAMVDIDQTILSP